MAITLSNDLKRQAVLNEVVRALKKRRTPLFSFGYKVQDTPLQGTDEIVVPYVPLVTAASTDYNSANGYVMSDGDVQAKKITLNKDKYQSLSFTDDQDNRQPLLLTDEVVAQKVDKLVVDVTTDVASIVTAANYGTNSWYGAASGFNIGAVGTLRGVANNANWGKLKRSLVLNADYDAKFVLDSAVIAALNYGSSEVIRTGNVPEVLGFGYYGGAEVPANGETLVGWISLPSAAAWAMAPVLPKQSEARNVMKWETYSDADPDGDGSDASFVLVYKEWYDPNYRMNKRVIETFYGYSMIEAAALKRITTTNT